MEKTSNTASALATVLNNLAYLYHMESRYADSETLYKQALAIRDLAHDPDVANTLTNLGGLYWEQRRYTEAEPLMKRALEVQEQVVGLHDATLQAFINNLAEVYISQGRYYKAEPLHKRALAIAEKNLGPDHAATATALNNLAAMYRDQGRYAEAEPLFKRALEIKEKEYGPNAVSTASTLRHLGLLYRGQGRYPEAETALKRALAIFEKTLGPDDREVERSLNELALLYGKQGRFAEALPLVRRIALDSNPSLSMALSIIFGAQVTNLISGPEALEESLGIVQRGAQTSAAEALNSLAARFSAGSGRLAELVRKEQDLAAETAMLDKRILAAVSAEPSKRDPAAEQRARNRLVAIVNERNKIQDALATDFPDYLSLSKPKPLSVADIRSRSMLEDDEAVVLIHLGTKSYVWVFTNSEAEWKEIAVTDSQVSNAVSKLADLGVNLSRPFDPQASFNLYQVLLGPVDNIIRGKPRLSLVMSGAITSLPPHVLVTDDPTGKSAKDVDWLIRRHAVTVLPSLGSLTE